MFSILAKYNLLLLGGPSENSFSQRYLDRTAVKHTPGKLSQLIALLFIDCSLFSVL